MNTTWNIRNQNLGKLDTLGAYKVSGVYILTTLADKHGKSIRST